jgi:hypothetical protein
MQPKKHWRDHQSNVSKWDSLAFPNNPFVNSPPPASAGIAIPESLYLEAVALKLMRPSGSGDLAQKPQSHVNSRIAIN